MTWRHFSVSLCLCGGKIAAGAFCLSALLLLTACSTQGRRFRVEAQFKNLNQGEFYMYHPDTGHKDTIAVNDGRFVYEMPVHDTLTLVLLFPNYSEIPIFATPGAHVTMEGDASHLRDTQVTGSAENDLMTEFRKKTADMVPPDATREAARFIREHPASVASSWLLRRFFLQNFPPDYPQAYELCKLLHKAQPANQHLARLMIQLETLKNYATSGQLPPFQAVSTQGDTISNEYLKADANVILAWASWSYDSQAPLHTLSDLLRTHKKRLRVVSICVDATPAEGRDILKRDSITWPNVCDSMLWQSPTLGQLGMATVPANIVTDRTGRIVARNLSNMDLKDKITDMLK